MRIIAGPRRGLRASTRCVWCLASAALAAVLSATPVLGQPPAKATQQNHRIRQATPLGVDVTVVDPSDAVIRKANVTLSPGKDAVAIARSTDSRGVVRYRSLAKQTYKITVQAPGFRTEQQTVTVEKVERLRVKLQIAVKAETIEVRALPGVVDTVDAATGIQLSYVPYIELPLNYSNRLAAI